MKFEDWLVIREGKEKAPDLEKKEELFDNGKDKKGKEVKLEKKVKPKVG